MIRITIQFNFPNKTKEKSNKTERIDKNAMTLIAFGFFSTRPIYANSSTT